jgi:23S rRNA (uracil1939-C5)-methyltransferase
LWGKAAIFDELDGLKFKISARSFFQVNPAQTTVLYRQAVEYAGLSGGETVVDAYCGVGSLTLFLARKAKKVYGLEVLPEAIRDARENAALNGITNTGFRVGATEKILPELVKEGIGFDVGVVDPPRSGCDREVLESFAAGGVGRIIYVSCNPATLARDLKLLAELGYGVIEIQPVDMFPQTFHVECVAKIVRNIEG